MNYGCSKWVEHGAEAGKVFTGANRKEAIIGTVFALKCQGSVILIGTCSECHGCLFSCSFFILDMWWPLISKDVNCHRGGEQSSNEFWTANLNLIGNILIISQMLFK